MFKNAIACRTVFLSPFDSGGNFTRAHSRKDPRALLMELHAEQEEIRSKRRVLQERIAMCSRMLSDCASESQTSGKKDVYSWLTGAAVVLIFSLLFSTGAVECGTCGRFGISTLLMLVGVILALRAWGEYRHVKKGKRNHDSRIAQYQKDSEELNEQLLKLNLREAELEASIRSAQRYI